MNKDTFKATPWKRNSQIGLRVSTENMIGEKDARHIFFLDIEPIGKEIKIVTFYLDKNTSIQLKIAKIAFWNDKESDHICSELIAMDKYTKNELRKWFHEQRLGYWLNGESRNEHEFIIKRKFDTDKSFRVIETKIKDSCSRK